jgi:hydroxymethylpyrimidine pyrophosphatase-like HAD family hydrolase
VTIGDSANDIEMFKCCSIKIAMGGAKDQLKQISTHITKNVEKGGVVYAIKNILKM